ncbi:L-histidine N(alpha)-methyltransferase [Acaryochloris sp. IP29b_bin.137]|uniref:L-histidine N(alpha)-methyltransferase n=1 Tax=Acaryochloris sp. IP29b_bin.137 TaxID=2969217 RepID=UPI0026130EB1|nr:L-histidine N(alpha)-methyltransferase [Acaryochloris sp. IP29b_bin.137]
MSESVYTETPPLSTPFPPELVSRLQLTQLALPQTDISKGLDVVQGLSQIPKTLPAQYFYDDRGSQLFEQICDLPEYYPTRTEAAILATHAMDIANATGPCELVELGSGSSTKTRLLLDAYASLGRPFWYCPIDVSGGILKQSALTLLQDYTNLHIHGYVGPYEAALASLSPPQLPTRMVCFLGSTLGNLSPQECEHFFSQLTHALQPGEYFLLGVDLHKSTQQLEAAYNDSQGVTAAFNLNMLQHLNWKFQGDFQVENFQHRAFYNSDEHQIEMHLDCLQTQQVTLSALDFSIAISRGESIRTEISRKFDLDLLTQQLQVRNPPEVQGRSVPSSATAKFLHPLKTWTDPRAWFGLILCQCRAEPALNL